MLPFLCRQQENSTSDFIGDYLFCHFLAVLAEQIQRHHWVFSNFSLIIIINWELEERERDAWYFLRLGWDGCWPVVHKANELFRPLNGWSLEAFAEVYHFSNGICSSINSVYLNILVNLPIAVCLFVVLLPPSQQVAAKSPYKGADLEVSLGNLYLFLQ